MNDIDLRDEQLAQVLDRAVRDLRPVPATAVAEYAGRRRRAVRVVASVVTVCVFVAAVVWAVGQVGDAPGRVRATSTIGTLDENGWTASYPNTWSVTPVPDCGGIDGYHGGFIVSNVDYRFHGPQGGPVGCGSGPVPDAFPVDGVALALVPGGAEHANLSATSLFPLSLDRFRAFDGSGGGPSESFQPIVIGDQEVAVATAWIGTAATLEERDALARTVVSLRYLGALEGSVYRDDGDGFTVDVPVGWTVSPVRINTWVADPHEILAMATYSLRSGGEGAIDAQVPTNALDDLGPNDMFIWLSERDGADASYPLRPAAFSPEAICSGYTECQQGRALGLQGIRAWWYYFRDEGRGLYVFVGMGETAYEDTARSQEAWEILDSLRFDP
jgi:hypothetical protein